MTAADIAVLLTVALMMWAHERRAMNRDKDRRADHATAIKEIRDARAVFLGSRQEVDSIVADVEDLKIKTADLDRRVRALEPAGTY